MEGLAKFVHLVNLDTVQDLLDLLKDLLNEVSEKSAHGVLLLLKDMEACIPSVQKFVRFNRLFGSDCRPFKCHDGTTPLGCRRTYGQAGDFPQLCLKTWPGLDTMVDINEIHPRTFEKNPKRSGLGQGLGV